MECWQECIQREIIIPTHLIRDKDEDGRVNQIYTDCLTGPLFAEFSAQVVQALHVPESEVMTAQGKDEPSMSVPENTLEDYLVDESALSSSSNAFQRPNCDHQTVVDFRLIGGENIEFADHNLMKTPAATDHQDKTSASGIVVNNNNYYYCCCCYCYHYFIAPPPEVNFVKKSSKGADKSPIVKDY